MIKQELHRPFSQERPPHCPLVNPHEGARQNGHYFFLGLQLVSIIARIGEDKIKTADVFEDQVTGKCPLTYYPL